APPGLGRAGRAPAPPVARGHRAPRGARGPHAGSLSPHPHPHALECRSNDGSMGRRTYAAVMDVSLLRSRRARGAAVVLVLAAVGLGWWLRARGQAHARAEWIAAYERLSAEMALGYANLGDRLASRNLSPAELDRAARRAL